MKWNKSCKSLVVFCFFMAVVFSTLFSYASTEDKTEFSEILEEEGFLFRGKTQIVSLECYIAITETSCTYGFGTSTKATFSYLDIFSDQIRPETKTTFSFGQYGCSVYVYNPRYKYKDYWSLLDRDVFIPNKISVEHKCFVEPFMPICYTERKY